MLYFYNNVVVRTAGVAGVLDNPTRKWYNYTMESIEVLDI
jgi:hypothetical protein